MSYAELAITTNFSFLRGASHPQEYVTQGVALGLAAIGIADRNTLAGVVRAYDAWNEIDGEKPRLLIGARLVFSDGTPDILVYPTDRAAYGRLCRLLSRGKLRAPKGDCRIGLDDLLHWQEGLLMIVMAPGRDMPCMAVNSTRFWNEDLGDDFLEQPPLTVMPAEAGTQLPSSHHKKRSGTPAFAGVTEAGWVAGVTEVGDATSVKNDSAGEDAGLMAAGGAAAAGSTHAIGSTLARLAAIAPGRLWLGVAMPYLGDDRRRLRHWRRQARALGVPLIAHNDVLYHEPGRRELQDVVTCIREHVSLDAAGALLEPNGERHLKAPLAMARLYREAPEAITETLRFAERISFSLSQLSYNYPDEPMPPGKTAQAYLEELTWQGADRRYPGGIPDEVAAMLRKELALIARLKIAPYFLTVHDIVSFARNRGILYQGRGSAANSAVCYMLGITAVDPTTIDLLFERFISGERCEPPDIDVDFEHERREEVIQDIYARYGHHRAALAATVIRYRPRSAIREAGKAFGLSEDVTQQLAASVWGSWGGRLKDSEVREGSLDPGNPMVARAVAAANQLIGFPRHLSQHVGGFVLTRDRLDELVPVGPATMEDRFFIEWDKDDIDTLRMMKVDVLALGMLTCIRKAFELMRRHEGIAHDLASVPREDARVYAMLQKADAIGVFQVESRAQMNMLPRLKPKDFYDLVIEVAIVRPGPIQGDMVHPYLRRRAGLEKVDYPSPAHGPADELHNVLSKTLGVPLFQEQAMRLAITAANFTPTEANGLRRAMATFRNLGTIDTFKVMFVERMVGRGYERDFAERCFKQIEGFGSYGFPESHAASFAHLVYISAWIKKHHPAAFAAALLNAQPMGFYAPAEIVRDAREHGVEVRHVDVNFSAWDNTLELARGSGLALRLGFRQVESFRETWTAALEAARGNGFSTVNDVARRARLSKRALMILAEADSFRSISMDRREILWAVRAIPDDDELPLFAARGAEERGEEEIAPLPAMPLSEHVLADYQMLRLSLKAHLMSFLRDLFRAEGVKSCAEIAGLADGARAACAGIVLVRQMPGNAGVVFITLSDEAGVANIVVWPKLVTEFRSEIMRARLMVVKGRVQKSPESVVHLIAERIFDRSVELARLSEDAPDLAQAPRHGHPRDARAVPKSRDFH